MANRLNLSTRTSSWKTAKYYVLVATGFKKVLKIFREETPSKRLFETINLQAPTLPWS